MADLKLKSKLPDLMQAKEISVEDLAHKLGISTNQIKHMCDLGDEESVHLSNNHIVKLCQFFSLGSVSQLFDLDLGSDDPDASNK